jgi:uncharacterized protein
MSELKARISEDMKAAMKGGDKPRLGVIRLILAALKQQEVDTRQTLSDADVLAVLEKMLKQRKDSLQQYSDAGRQDLADQEAFEITVIKAYMPEPLSEAELNAAIEAALSASGASSMRDMGKLMALLKPQIQGRADMGQVSALVKQRLE